MIFFDDATVTFVGHSSFLPPNSKKVDENDDAMAIQIFFTPNHNQKKGPNHCIYGIINPEGIGVLWSQEASQIDP